MQLRGMRIILLLLAFISLILAFSACEPLTEIRVQNKTDMALQIYQGFAGDEILMGSAAPHNEMKFKTETIYQNYRVAAKDENGNVLFATTFTSKDLQGKNEYLVTITQDKLIPH